jgi:hypothetical protein
LLSIIYAYDGIFLILLKNIGYLLSECGG